MASDKGIISNFISSMSEKTTDVKYLGSNRCGNGITGYGWMISVTSCWMLNWNGTCLLVDSFPQSTHKKLEGCRGVVHLFKRDIFRVTALVKGDRKPDPKADWHQNDGIVLKAFKNEFEYYVFLLLKKPGCLVCSSHFLRCLVGCELRKALLELVRGGISVFVASSWKDCIFNDY